jgi:hypothetical protein
MRMLSVNRAISYVVILLIFLVPTVILVNLIKYNLLEDENDDTVTIEFHCPTVLAMKENYPMFVINECQRMHEK